MPVFMVLGNSVWRMLLHVLLETAEKVLQTAGMALGNAIGSEGGRILGQLLTGKRGRSPAADEPAPKRAAAVER